MFTSRGRDEKRKKGEMGPPPRPKAGSLAMGIYIAGLSSYLVRLQHHRNTKFLAITAPRRLAVAIPPRALSPCNPPPGLGFPRRLTCPPPGESEGEGLGRFPGMGCSPRHEALQVCSATPIASVRWCEAFFLWHFPCPPLSLFGYAAEGIRGYPAGRSLSP